MTQAGTCASTNHAEHLLPFLSSFIQGFAYSFTDYNYNTYVFFLKNVSCQRGEFQVAFESQILFEIQGFIEIIVGEVVVKSTYGSWPKPYVDALVNIIMIMLITMMIIMVIIITILLLLSLIILMRMIILIITISNRSLARCYRAPKPFEVEGIQSASKGAIYIYIGI